MKPCQKKAFRYLLVLSQFLSPFIASAGEKRPNIVLFYADDLGYSDLSCQGSSYYKTPHIDRIGKEGITFTNAYAAAANCAPSRASLLSGLYTPRHGVFTVNNSDRGKAKHRKLIPIKNTEVLAPKFTTLAESLKSAGYQTCIAGKWHVSPDPTKDGFDTNFGGNKSGHPRSYFSPYKNPQLKDGPKGEHLPERLGRDVSNWIADHKETPFFVYLPFYSVHTPIQARDDLAKKYSERPKTEPHHNPKYAAMIEAMDLAVGQVLKTLEEQDLSDNTLVIFTSDNGPHGNISRATPLRGVKGMYYEGGIREPFLAKLPGVIKAGSTNDTPIHQVDLYPTLLSFAKATGPKQLDGIDLTPALKGEPLPERNLYWHFPAYLQGYGLDGGSASPFFRTTPCGVIRDGDWKLIQYFEDNTLELYNLKDDLSETTNLAEKNPEKTQALLKKLQVWQTKVSAPIPTKVNPSYRKE